MLFKSIKESIQSIGKTLNSPTFIKEYSSMDDVINSLTELRNTTNKTEIQTAIDLDLSFIKQGQHGEQNVYYELKNSFIPMYILHNLFIQFEDYQAQLDFVIVTNRFICILETKKLNGDITINNQGEFIRTFRYKDGKFIKKEGMYSPISQNQRHVRILKDLLIKDKVIRHTPVLSLVVMANPKSIIDHKFAPKEIKQQIIKYDQLTSWINNTMTKHSETDLPVVSMQNIAEYMHNKHVEKENTFITKYSKLINEQCQLEVVPAKEVTYESQENTIKDNIEVTTQENSDTQKPYNVDIDKLREQLVEFRRITARKEDIKAYFIFNNNQMEDILTKIPHNKEELLNCNGFGAVKVEKYGDEILKIINSI